MKICIMLALHIDKIKDDILYSGFADINYKGPHSRINVPGLKLRDGTSQADFIWARCIP